MIIRLSTLVSLDLMQPAALAAGADRVGRKLEFCSLLLTFFAGAQTNNLDVPRTAIHSKNPREAPSLDPSQILHCRINPDNVPALVVNRKSI